MFCVFSSVRFPRLHAIQLVLERIRWHTNKWIDCNRIWFTHKHRTEKSDENNVELKRIWSEAWRFSTLLFVHGEVRQRCATVKMAWKQTDTTEQTKKHGKMRLFGNKTDDATSYEWILIESNDMQMNRQCVKTVGGWQNVKWREKFMVKKSKWQICELWNHKSRESMNDWERKKPMTKWIRWHFFRREKTKIDFSLFAQNAVKSNDFGHFQSSIVSFVPICWWCDFMFVFCRSFFHSLRRFASRHSIIFHLVFHFYLHPAHMKQTRNRIDRRKMQRKNKNRECTSCVTPRSVRM